MIGAGSRAQAYAPVFAAHESAELVAVADPDLLAAARASEPLGCRVFDSHASLLRWGDFDAALICAPPVTRAPIALDVARSGKHVLCEPPLSPDVASARRMLRAASRCAVQLTMVSKFRLVGDVVQAQAFIAAGVLGDVLTFENAFAHRVDVAGSWRAAPNAAGGGVIADQGSHALDLLRYVCGPISAIAAYEGARVQKVAVEDTAHVVARTTSGVLGSIDLSWSCDQESDHYLRICGTEGEIAVGWARSRYRRNDGHGWVSFGCGYDAAQALHDQLDNFCRALGGEEQLAVTPDDALAAVEAIAAAHRSLRSDRWVPVEPTAEGVERRQPELAAVSLSAAT